LIRLLDKPGAIGSAVLQPLQIDPKGPAARTALGKPARVLIALAGGGY